MAQPPKEPNKRSVSLVIQTKRSSIIFVDAAYIVIAPEHFVSGERIPSQGAYDTTAFHAKHPEWTAVASLT